MLFLIILSSIMVNNLQSMAPPDDTWANTYHFWLKSVAYLASSNKKFRSLVHRTVTLNNWTIKAFNQ